MAWVRVARSRTGADSGHAGVFARHRRPGHVGPRALVAEQWARFLGSAVAVALVMFVGAVPAHAKVTVTVSDNAVVQGDRVVIQAAARPKVKFCDFWLKGHERTLLATKRVRKGRSTLGYATDALMPGQYRITVHCGKAGKGNAQLVVSGATPAPTQAPDPVVAPTPVQPPPPPATQSATCTVAESGGRYRSDGGVASAGLRLFNSSSSYDATGIEVTFNFWSGDAIVSTRSRYLERIPAGQSLLVGIDWVFSDTPIARVSAYASCGSESAGRSIRVVGATATAVPTVLDDIDVRGQFTNTYPFPLSTLATIDYVTRGSDGKINGGGYTYVSGMVPVGVTTGWQIGNPAFSPTLMPASIEFTVEPEPA